MKTFIFLLIAIVALFGYIFFTPSPQDHEEEIVPVAPAVTLASVEPNETTDTIDTEMADTEMALLKNRMQRHATTPARTAPTDTTSPVVKNDLPAIQEDMTFLELRGIVHRINPDYPRHLITLDTPMRTLLPTRSEQEAFVEAIGRQFHLNASQTKHYMTKNRLLWDWVNMLR